MPDMPIILQIRGSLDSITDKSNPDKDYKMAVVRMQGLKLVAFGDVAEYINTNVHVYKQYICEATVQVKKGEKYINYDLVHLSMMTPVNFDAV